MFNILKNKIKLWISQINLYNINSVSECFDLIVKEYYLYQTVMLLQYYSDKVPIFVCQCSNLKAGFQYIVRTSEKLSKNIIFFAEFVYV